MTKVIFYLATSKDGFIADKEGGVDWLPTPSTDFGHDFGYKKFYDSIDTIAMGSKTYEQVIGFGEWAWSGKPTYVFTHRPLPSISPDIHFVCDDIEAFLKKIEESGSKNLWLLGGSALADSFEHCGRIDEYIVTIVPHILKEGIPLRALGEGLAKGSLVKISSWDCGQGFIQECYHRKPQALIVKA
jgi:dihydrofolate reductase